MPLKNLKPPQFLTSRVITILLMESAERFSYYGFRAVLTLYFVHHLHYTETKAVSLFAFTGFVAYLTPLLGAYLADTVWGLYQTIVVFGVLYVVGMGVLTGAAFGGGRTDGSSGDDTSVVMMSRSTRLWSFVGLFLVCLGTGGIKPCVSTFGAVQILDAQNHHNHNKDDKKRDDANVDQGTDQDASERNVDSKDESISRTSGDVLVQQFYSWFYFCINLGSVLSYAIVPSVRASYGYGAAFLVPCVFIVFAMLCFWSKRNEYVDTNPVGTPSHPPPPTSSSFQKREDLDQEDESNNEDDHSSQMEAPSLPSTFRILLILIKAQTTDAKQEVGVQPKPDRITNCNRLWYCHQQKHSFYDIVPDSEIENKCKAQNTTNAHLQNTYGLQQIKDAKATLRILPVFAFLPIFWMLYDQNSSVWTLQATHLNLHSFEAEQLGILNPVLILVLIPLFDGIVYPSCVRRGWNTSHLRRMSIGMIVLSLAFFISAALQYFIDARGDDGTIGVVWIVPQYVLLSVAEILVSVTSLEFSYSYAPDSMKALIMAMNLLTTCVGDLLAGVLYTLLVNLDIVYLLELCAVLMLVNLFWFHWFVVLRWDNPVTSSLGMDGTYGGSQFDTDSRDEIAVQVQLT